MRDVLPQHLIDNAIMVFTDCTDLNCVYGDMTLATLKNNKRFYMMNSAFFNSPSLYTVVGGLYYTRYLSEYNGAMHTIDNILKTIINNGDNPNNNTTINPPPKITTPTPSPTPSTTNSRNHHKNNRDRDNRDNNNNNSGNGIQQQVDQLQKQVKEQEQEILLLKHQVARLSKILPLDQQLQQQSLVEHQPPQPQQQQQQSGPNITTRVCKGCSTSFTIAHSEKSHYDSKNLSWPKKCQSCRQKKPRGGRGSSGIPGGDDWWE
ncbi:hypothetical protein DFA_03561 [Cavenderia fasciculata]|uniref:Probable zinc-binding domain-containing protein n=1 Tax=Cavenderia fasciculata TaxID=261658 RepID=F4PHX8_CACFS|nr:uncharacterized protein DFA_03561 [Cavenderia fasciculata]EGG25312.1 hypothetical protein DFA_03561 [Cavenderia fasciculata]|eukprot:XP_004363163.1 hypothetical protein DFA_03561 [Cavenderia fasciculata]